MEITIQPLSPTLAQTFCDYLSGLDFAATPHWASCFCRFYHTTCSQQEWMSRTLEENRAEAIQEIESGLMRGYLAFDGTRCIGWCNANDIKNLPRLTEDTSDLCRDRRVGCTICYVIHPDYRGKSIARSCFPAQCQTFSWQGMTRCSRFRSSRIPQSNAATAVRCICTSKRALPRSRQKGRCM